VSVTLHSGTPPPSPGDRHRGILGGASGAGRIRIRKRGASGLTTRGSTADSTPDAEVREDVTRKTRKSTEGHRSSLEKPLPNDAMQTRRGGSQASKALWEGGFHHRPTVAWQSTHLEAHFLLQILVDPDPGQDRRIMAIFGNTDLTVVTLDPRLGDVELWDHGTGDNPVLFCVVHIRRFGPPILLLNIGSGVGGLPEFIIFSAWSKIR